MERGPKRFGLAWPVAIACLFTLRGVCRPHIFIQLELFKEIKMNRAQYVRPSQRYSSSDRQPQVKELKKFEIARAIMCEATFQQ